MNFLSRLRTITGLFLLGTISGGIPSTSAAAIPIPLHDVMQIVSQQPPAPEPGTLANSGTPATNATPAPDRTTPTTATPAAAKHRISPWVWAVIVGGVAAGIGGGLIAGNSHSNQNAAAASSATINSGPGGVVVGGPH